MRIPAYPFFIVLFVLITACVQPPEYPNEPIIEFVSFNKNTIVQGSGSNNDVLEITISYTDGDGNLGSDPQDTSDAPDVVLIDSRDNIEVPPYRIPLLPKQGVQNGISGEITIELTSGLYGLCCIFDDKDGELPCTPSTRYPTDTMRYIIYVRDQDGNESNRIETDPIILLCQ